MIKRLEYHKEVFALNNLENDDLSFLKGSKDSWIQFLVERIDKLYIFVKYDEDELLNYIVAAKDISIPISSSILILHVANDLFLNDLLEKVDELRSALCAMEVLIETDKEELYKQYGFTKKLTIMKREL